MTLPARLLRLDWVQPIESARTRRLQPRMKFHERLAAVDLPSAQDISRGALPAGHPTDGSSSISSIIQRLAGAAALQVKGHL